MNLMINKETLEAVEKLKKEKPIKEVISEIGKYLEAQKQTPKHPQLTDDQIEAMPNCGHCFHYADEHRHMRQFGDRYMHGWHICEHPECDESDQPCLEYVEPQELMKTHHLEIENKLIERIAAEEAEETERRNWSEDTEDIAVLYKAGYLSDEQKEGAFDNAILCNPSRHPICDYRVGLDCDGVIFNFGQHIIVKAAEMGLSEHFPEDWTKIDKWMFSGKFMDVWNVHHLTPEFWLGVPPFELALEAIAQMPGFVPTLYLTARPIDSSVTKEALFKHKFPDSIVITVDDKNPHDKIDILLHQHPVDIFVDDRPDTVRKMREAGINAVLFAAPFHISCDITDLPVIYSLTEMIDYVQKK